MGGGIAPTIVDRGGTGGAQGPKGLLWGDVEGPIRGKRATGIAELGAHGLRGCRIGAYGPRGCRFVGHAAPDVAGPTDIESLTAGVCLAPSSQRTGQLGSRAIGGGEDGVYGLPVRVAGGEEVAGGVRKWLVFGCSSAVVLRCWWRPLYIVG